MRWRALLLHRFVLVPLLLALAAGAWNLHVALNADGIIAGEVRDATGAPIAGAEVVFFERNMLNYQEQRRTSSDAAGAYRFDNMVVHIGQLEARTADGRTSERYQLRLWFRAQNTRVPPLVVGRAGG